tara:strand:- start:526 stop:714 length:189 start_codon:yes stop_codon:yes gene_type:complete
MTDKRLSDVDKELMESNGVNVVMSPKVTRHLASKSVPPIELSRLFVIFLGFLCLSVPIWLFL